MRLAFTGTRQGCTVHQKAELMRFFDDLRNNGGNLETIVAVHGACMGADVQFHKACLAAGVATIVIWPSNNQSTNRVTACTQLDLQKKGYLFTANRSRLSETRI
jgi:hypothetical protein